MRILLPAAAVVLAVAGCSSPPNYTPPSGQLVSGTAQVSINGGDAVRTDAVACNTTEWLTTITTGDDASGVNAVLSSRDELAAESVGIRDLGGFTGSFNAGLGGDAKVAMTGRTYDISGTADGFDTANPSFRKSGTFSIKVSC